ncbi:MAG: hypothetical protein ACRDTS_14955, partial [Mycobacterium sp.]
MSRTDSTPAYRSHRHTDRCRRDPAGGTWICPVEAQNSTVGRTELIDTRDMLVLHAALSREFRLAPA